MITTAVNELKDWDSNLMCSMSVHYIIQKTLITNKCTKSFFINCNTPLHVSTLLGHLQEELSTVVTLRLPLYWRENVLLTVYCVAFGGVNSLWSRLALPAGRDRREFTPPVHSTQSTAHSHSTIKCNLSVTITKKFSLKMTQALSKHVGVYYDWW
jgi:hypothetical protein